MDPTERAARYSDLFAARREQPHECDYCPICTTFRLVRNTRPEVFQHMASAAREITAAFGILLEEAGQMIAAAEAAARTVNEEPTAEDHAKVRRIDAS